MVPSARRTFTGLAAVSAVAAVAVGVDGFVPRAAAAHASGAALPAHLGPPPSAQPAVLPESVAPATAAPGPVVAALAPDATATAAPAAGAVLRSADSDASERRVTGGVRARGPPR
jgi:hypothetical protein